MSSARDTPVKISAVSMSHEVICLVDRGTSCRCQSGISFSQRLHALLASDRTIRIIGQTRCGDGHVRRAFGCPSECSYPLSDRIDVVKEFCSQLVV